jgi:FAD-dependent urate hydroxylase
MRTTNVAIIGAGPYGLSVSACLRADGVDHEIFGQPMSSWRHNMPPAMKLRSEPHASNLWDSQRHYTLEAFCRESGLSYQASGRPLPLANFLDYTEWFEKHAVPDVQQLELSRLKRAGDGFNLQFSNDHLLWAKNVIVATGHLPFRNIPLSLSHLPDKLVSHTADYGDLARFRGQNVIVVGAGQSALETAALLHDEGANVRIIMRRKRVSWNGVNQGGRPLLNRIICPEAGLGFGWRNVAVSNFPQTFSLLPNPVRAYVVARSHGPSGAWWLKDRVSGSIPVLSSIEIERACELRGRVHLVVKAEGTKQSLEASHVIAATGFKPDLRRLSFLDPELMMQIDAFNGIPNAIPRLSHSGESSVPGLFFVGIITALTFGPVMRFMFGAKHIAHALARRFSAQGGLRRLRSPEMAERY